MRIAPRARVPMTPMVLCGVDDARLAWRGRPRLPCDQAPLEKLVGAGPVHIVVYSTSILVDPAPDSHICGQGATVYTHSNWHPVSCKQVVPATTPAALVRFTRRCSVGRKSYNLSDAVHTRADSANPLGVAHSSHPTTPASPHVGAILKPVWVRSLGIRGCRGCTLAQSSDHHKV